MRRIKLRRADLLVFAALILAAALLLGLRFAVPRAKEAVISVGGTEVARVALSGAKGVIWNDSHLTVEAEGGAVRVTSADCPDKLCVAAGDLTRAGDCAVCVPNRTVVRLVGRNSVVVTY